MEILREAIFNYPILVPRYFEEKHDST
jgi:hypothetical protein